MNMNWIFCFLTGCGFGLFSTLLYILWRFSRRLEELPWKVADSVRSITQFEKVPKKKDVFLTSYQHRFISRLVAKELFNGTLEGDVRRYRKALMKEFRKITEKTRSQDLLNMSAWG